MDDKQQSLPDDPDFPLELGPLSDVVKRYILRINEKLIERTKALNMLRSDSSTLVEKEEKIRKLENELVLERAAASNVLNLQVEINTIKIAHASLEKKYHNVMAYVTSGVVNANAWMCLTCKKVSLSPRNAGAVKICSDVSCFGQVKQLKDLSPTILMDQIAKLENELKACQINLRNKSKMTDTQEKEVANLTAANNILHTQLNEAKFAIEVFKGSGLGRGEEKATQPRPTRSISV